MIWTEQHFKKEKEYEYKVEDFFGDLTLRSKRRLDKRDLDSLFIHISSLSSGENQLEYKNKGGIIDIIIYKLNKNTKPLWEKVSQEELLRESTNSTENSTS